MDFETTYEKDYMVFAYYLKHELIEMQLGNGKKVFREVEIGDTENIEMVPGAYVLYAPVNIAEDYVGPRTTTHVFVWSIMVRLATPKTPLDLLFKIARFHGLIYNRFIGDRSMTDPVILALVDAELGTTETGPLCQHRTIGGWRPPVGVAAPNIYFDLSVEKRTR